MVVAEIMTPNPVVVAANQPLSAALAALDELAVRHLPVIDDGSLVGILSDRDLAGLRHHAPNDRGSSDASPSPRVGDVMSSDVVSVAPETEVKALIEQMLEAKIGAIVVVDPRDDSLVGIVSYVDVMSKLADTLP